MADKGAPTKYNPDMLAITEEYMNNYAEHGHLIPSIVGLSEVLDVCVKTLYNWSEKPNNSAFLHMLGKLKARQERILLEGGLSSEFNATITKLALTKHGYTDKVEQDVTSKGKEIRNNFTIIPVAGKDS